MFAVSCVCFKAMLMLALYELFSPLSFVIHLSLRQLCIVLEDVLLVVFYIRKTTNIRLRLDYSLFDLLFVRVYCVAQNSIFGIMIRNTHTILQ